MISIDLIVFWIFAGIAIASAIYVIKVQEIMHSVVYLACLFISIACIFILLSSEYVAMIQILVYVGAVVVVILFGIMLTKREVYDQKRKPEESKDEK